MQAGRCTDGVRPFVLMLFLTLLGCGEALPPSAKSSSPQTSCLASHFEASTAGTIQGQVTWDGPVPQVAALTFPGSPMAAGVLRRSQVRPHPNAPQVEEETKGVGTAVVFLRGVDLPAARPWDQPAVRVEQRDWVFHIRQGEADSSYGFVQCGAPVVLVSCDPLFHALHARGADFFTYTFPDPDQPRTRRLATSGLVELTSAAGYAWMRAYLFVAEHPYYTRTDREGRFVLPQVPPGRYEVVCWMPSWLKARHERDPETSQIARLFFQPPVERVQPVYLDSGGSAIVNFTFATEHFQPSLASRQH